MKRLGGIYLRFFVPFAGVLVLAMFCAWWIAAALLSSTLNRRLDDQLSYALAAMADGVFPVTEDVLRQASQLLRADVVVVNKRGEPVLSTAELGDELEATLRAQLQAGEPLGRHRSFRILMRPFAQGRDTRYAAIAAIADLGVVREAAQRAALLLALATAGAAIVLAVAGHHLASSITRPIGELSGMAKRIAAGERAVRVGTAEKNEIGALTHSLNDMAAKLEQYEKELEEQSRLTALGEMAARIAHEVRNPLTAIKLKLELLADAPHAASTDVIARLLREIERLELIVSSTLSVARPRNLNVAPTDLNAVVDDVATLLEPQLVHQRIRLSKMLGALPRAELDSDRVRQILFNLLNNAAAAQPRGGDIRVLTQLDSTPAPPAVCLTVEDAGPGMPEETWAALQAKPSASRLGLGLKLCRELVELHGGSLSMDRSPKLGGARFTVTFPVSIIA
jgi:signal transduction histidine kinase